MLLLPFIIVALAAGFSQSVRPGPRPIDLARAPSPPTDAPARPLLPPRVALVPSTEPPVVLSRSGVIPPALPQSHAPAQTQSQTPALPEPAPPSAAPVAIRSAAFDATVVVPAPPAPVQTAAVALSVAAATALEPVEAPAVPPGRTILGPPLPEIEVAAILVPEPATVAPAASVCVATPGGLAKPAASAAITPPGDPSEFGAALASAALSQTREFVVYNDKYRRIAYPMGDVSSFYGVCTDVLIRAYRTLSIDLQALVQQTRSGSGDPNIDHRRVDTLRRFFAKHGQSIPITEFAEDYRPGDVVSYWRPQNRHSRTHIAIVANEIGPSGRPMIIHNRGWGPQLEDGLFVDQITGHYRFTGLRSAPSTSAVAESGASAGATPTRGPAQSAAAQSAVRRANHSKAALSKAAGIPANAATP